MCPAGWYPETGAASVPSLLPHRLLFAGNPGSRSSSASYTSRAPGPQLPVSTEALRSGGSSRRGGRLTPRRGSRGPPLPAGTDRLTRCLPSQPRPCRPHPLGFPRRNVSGLAPTMPAPRHGEQTCPEHDCLDTVWPHVGSKRSGVTGVIVPESCGSEAVTPVPRECLGAGGVMLAASPPPGTTHKVPFMGTRQARALAVSASGKLRFGFSPRAQPGLCLDFAHPHPGLASLLGTRHPGLKPFQADPSEAGHQDTPPKTAQGMFPTKTSPRTYYALSNGIAVEPATEEGGRCDKAN